MSVFRVCRDPKFTYGRQTPNVFCNSGHQSDSSPTRPQRRGTPLAAPRCCFLLGSPLGLFLTIRGPPQDAEAELLPHNVKLFNVVHLSQPPRLHTRVIDNGFKPEGPGLRKP